MGRHPDDALLEGDPPGASRDDRSDRGEMLPGARGGGSEARRRPGVLPLGALSDQGAHEGSERALRRGVVRTHVLRGRVLRIRRLVLRGGQTSANPVSRDAASFRAAL
ncbi:hypothetical protein SDC9_204834 [bioreactor metagenome]|uniref:Uncharacterized protein n=1 Tax=bioreactor metagenome TaxID=1076179 RepID=A0A645J1U2_9ZZZZ